jgi:hypothetical protein
MKDCNEAQIRTREQKDRIAALRELVDAAEASGVSVRTVDEIFAEARAAALIGVRHRNSRHRNS